MQPKDPLRAGYVKSLQDLHMLVGVRSARLLHDLRFACIDNESCSVLSIRHAVQQLLEIVCGMSDENRVVGILELENVVQGRLCCKLQTLEVEKTAVETISHGDAVI